MFDRDREGSAPDVLDVDDPAVRRCSPPAPVWVDLAALTQHRERGWPYSDARPDGVSPEDRRPCAGKGN